MRRRKIYTKTAADEAENVPKGEEIPSQKGGNWSLIAKVEALKGMQQQHQKKLGSNCGKTVACPRDPNYGPGKDSFEVPKRRARSLGRVASKTFRGGRRLETEGD